MAKVYGTSGAFSDLVDRLNLPNSMTFKDAEEVTEFVEKFDVLKKKVVNEAESKLNESIETKRENYLNLLAQYQEQLTQREDYIQKSENELVQTLASIPNKSNNLIATLINKYQTWRKSKRLEYIRQNRTQLINQPYKHIFIQLNKDWLEIDDLICNYDQWLTQAEKQATDEIDQIYQTIQANKPLYLGAIGEYKAEQTLTKLPSDYVVINNYCAKFSPPIRIAKYKENIFSVQIDHVVIGPTGVYLIETKNWSKASISSDNLYSPIKQAKRTGRAIFVALNSYFEKKSNSFLQDNWETIKIKPQSILLLLNHKPLHEYQYVEILTTKEINQFITSRKIYFNNEQVDEIAAYFREQ